MWSLRYIAAPFKYSISRLSGNVQAAFIIFVKERFNMTEAIIAVVVVVVLLLVLIVLTVAVRYKTCPPDKIMII